VWSKHSTEDGPSKKRRLAGYSEQCQDPLHSAALAVVEGKGLHSSTFQLDLTVFVTVRQTHQADATQRNPQKACNVEPFASLTLTAPLTAPQGLVFRV
jgi:hypothetical protein